MLKLHFSGEKINIFEYIYIHSYYFLERIAFHLGGDLRKEDSEEKKSTTLNVFS